DMPKKKLLIILGAGSSLAQGMPSVADLSRCMQQWSAAWVLPSGQCDYFEKLWTAAEAYYQAGPPALRPQPNFEKVLGDMVALATWMAPAPNGNSLRQIVNTGAPPSLPFPGFHPWAPFTTLHEHLIELLIRLAQHMRGLSQGINSSTQNFQHYKQLL